MNGLLLTFLRIPFIHQLFIDVVPFLGLRTHKISGAFIVYLNARFIETQAAPNMVAYERDDQRYKQPFSRITHQTYSQMKPLDFTLLGQLSRLVENFKRTT
jgi:hypothetical protein